MYVYIYIWENSNSRKQKRPKKDAVKCYYNSTKRSSIPNLKRIGNFLSVFHHHKQSLAPSSRPATKFKVNKIQNKSKHIKESILIQQKYNILKKEASTKEYTWATKLLTTRPSSIHILGPYVLKILAILTCQWLKIFYQ